MRRWWCLTCPLREVERNCSSGLAVELKAASGVAASAMLLLTHRGELKRRRRACLAASEHIGERKSAGGIVEPGIIEGVGSASTASRHREPGGSSAACERLSILLTARQLE